MLEMGEVLLCRAENAPENASIYYLEIYAPLIARASEPGQFVHLQVSSTYDPLLRRPMSLYKINKEEGTIGILFSVVGIGTNMLSEFSAGDGISLMGPLGRGFDLDIDADRIHLVAGGIGLAPLLPAALALKRQGKEVTVLLGVKSKGFLGGISEFQEAGITVRIATEDGSLGRQGYVTDILRDETEKGGVQYIISCGPNPMLRAVEVLALARGIPGQVSLESYMGCGVGACLVCACRRKNTDGGNVEYAKICLDGPVFKFGEVEIDG